ncbi:hypothetical protein B7486_57640, partial [cyanobacterium TDX16]
MAGAPVLLPSPVRAAEPAPPIVVTTTADVVDPGDGVTSLREAVDQANAAVGPDVIQLDPTRSGTRTYELTICGGEAQEDANADGDLDLLDPEHGLTLEGGFSTIRQTCPDERVLDSPTSAPLDLLHVRLTGGRVVGHGGAIRMASGEGAGALRLDGVELVDNRSSGDGGGVSNYGGPSDVVRSSITGNRTDRGKGAGASFVGGRTSIVSSTIAGNWTVRGDIGGLRVSAVPLRLDHVTILANRSAPGQDLAAAANLSAPANTTVRATVVAQGVGSSDCALSPSTGAMTSLGANRDGDGSCPFTHADDLGSGHPMLSVADDEGWTVAHLPADLSPVLDAIDPADCTQAEDQRTTARIGAGDGCDAGAVERL